MDSCGIIISTFWDNPKRNTNEEKIFIVSRTLGSTHGHNILFWKRNGLRFWDVHYSWAVANRLDLGRAWFEDGWAWHLGKYADWSPNGQRMWGYLSRVNAHQKVTSAEDGSRQDDPFCGELASSQPSLSFTSWGREQNGHGRRDGAYVWAQQHELLFTKADLATAAAGCQICQQQRPTLSLRYGTVL